MKRFVEITTPIPSLEEVAERLGMSKSRLRRIRKIVDSLDAQPRSSNARISAKQRAQRNALSKEASS